MEDGNEGDGVTKGWRLEDGQGMEDRGQSDENITKCQGIIKSKTNQNKRTKDQIKEQRKGENCI